jgi:hypothetical protein
VVVYGKVVADIA